MYEELLISGDEEKTDNPRIFKSNEKSIDIDMLKEIIQICKKLTGHEIDIKVNDNLKRKNDIPVIIGDTTKMLSLISKHKFRNFENTLKWMLLEDKDF